MNLTKLSLTNLPSNTPLTTTTTTTTGPHISGGAAAAGRGQPGSEQVLGVLTRKHRSCHGARKVLASNQDDGDNGNLMVHIDCSHAVKMMATAGI